MANIAIVGAGLMGRLTALSLHRQGYQVTLFDKDTKSAFNSAAYAAAGLLTPLGEAISCEANIVAMGMESLTLWPEIIKGLSEYVFFQQQGSLLVSHPQDQGDYQRFSRFLQQHYPQYPLQVMDRQQITRLEPELSRSFNQGLFLPQEGQIGNRRLLIALRQQLEQENINWLCNSQVTGIEPQQDSCTLLYQTSAGHHQQDYDFVVDCRGTGAAKASKTPATDLTDLRSVRGELFQLYAPDVNISRPIRLMHPRYQLYIAPKTKGYYVVGATEIESEDSGSMTVRSAMELLSAAYSVHPGFAEANIRQHISQLRPAFSDNQPQTLVHPRLLQVNGLYRHGFLIAPVILQQTVEIVNALAAHFSEKSQFQQAKLKAILADSEFSYAHLLPVRTQNANLY